jgi:ATP-binding cassette subfamily C (CFTR/MRP) protein 1
VDSDLKGSATYARLEASWLRYRRLRFGLARATLAANFWPFVSAAAPRLALSAFTFCQPFLLNASVSYLNGDTEVVDRPNSGRALVGAFVLVYLGIAVSFCEQPCWDETLIPIKISRAVYSRQTYRLLSRVRAGLTTKIYRHTTALHTRHVQDSAVLTLMGTDVERIVSALRTVHELWANVFEITIGVWLLTRQVSFASIMPLTICLGKRVLAGSFPKSIAKSVFTP